MLDSDSKTLVSSEVAGGSLKAFTYPDDMVGVFSGLANVFRQVSRVTGRGVNFDDSSEAAPSVEEPFAQLVGGGSKTTRRFQHLREEMARFINREADVGETITMHFTVSSPSKVSVFATHEPVSERGYRNVALTTEAADEHDIQNSLKREQRKCYSMYTKASFCDEVCLPGSELTISFTMLDEDVLGVYVSQTDGFIPSGWWSRWSYIRMLNKERKSD